MPCDFGRGARLVDDQPGVARHRLFDDVAQLIGRAGEPAGGGQCLGENDPGPERHQQVSGIAGHGCRRAQLASRCLGVALREEDPAASLMDERRAGVLGSISDAVRRLVRAAQVAGGDEYLNGERQRLGVDREPLILLEDVSRQVDRACELVVGEPGPDLRRGVVDGVLQLRSGRDRRQHGLRLLVAAELDEDLGQVHPAPPHHLAVAEPVVQPDSQLGVLAGRVELAAGLADVAAGTCPGQRDQRP